MKKLLISTYTMTVSDTTANINLKTHSAYFSSTVFAGTWTTLK